MRQNTATRRRRSTKTPTSPRRPLLLEELESRLVPTVHLYTVPEVNSQPQTTLTFDFAAGLSNVDEIGVYTVENAQGMVNGKLPTDFGYAHSAMTASQIVFSKGQGAGTQKTLSFAPGTGLAFFLVSNDTTTDVETTNPGDTFNGHPIFFSIDEVNPDGVSHVQTVNLAHNAETFYFNDHPFDGNAPFNSVIFTVGTTPDTLGQAPGNSTQTNFGEAALLSRSSAFNDEVGIYVTDDANGTVAGLHPGDPGYAAAALARSRREVLISPNQGLFTPVNFTLPGGSNFGFYLIQGDTADDFLARNAGDSTAAFPDAFFSFAAANSDGFDHFRWMPGDNFIWEDLTTGGDKDFNDVVGGIDFGSLVKTAPLTPTLTLDPNFDTNVAGDNITSLASVTLDGTTEANTAVRLTQTGATTTSDANGNFSFTNVALANGANSFTVVATNAAGDSSSFTTTITRQATAPKLTTAISNQTLAKSASTTLDLAGNFIAPDELNTMLQMSTVDGPINFELFDQQAPRTVANFLNYVNSGRYNESIFHRSVPGFVLQGGGFTFTTSPSALTPITADPAVQGEADPVNRSNVTGTLAMAQVGTNPNSATDEFFFNLANNDGSGANNLNTLNGGFTVFGKVVSSSDLGVVNQIAAIPTQDQSTAAALPPSEQGTPGNGVFAQIPLINYTGTHFPTDTTAANYALVSSVKVTRMTDSLTYTATSSNTSVVTASITNERLTLQAGGQAGTAQITVVAKNTNGLTTTTTFNVTVS
jgi:cyclophilin family peptidyl-prolyl cis-trans isomerase